MTEHDLPRDYESLSLDELKRAVESGEITLQEVRENETLRRRFRRIVVRNDLEEHRDIYDRLAEV